MSAIHGSSRQAALNGRGSGRGVWTSQGGEFGRLGNAARTQFLSAGWWCGFSTGKYEERERSAREPPGRPGAGRGRRGSTGDRSGGRRGGLLSRENGGNAGGRGRGGPRGEGFLRQGADPGRGRAAGGGPGGGLNQRTPGAGTGRGAHTNGQGRGSRFAKTRPVGAPQARRTRLLDVSHRRVPRCRRIERPPGPA